MRDTVIFVVILSPIISYGFRLAKYKRPQRWKPGPVIQEENAAPHHEWDSTIKAFRSFKANLREVYVIGLAVVASFSPFITDNL
jgi:hypothetical protein